MSGTGDPPNVRCAICGEEVGYYKVKYMNVRYSKDTKPICDYCFDNPVEE